MRQTFVAIKLAYTACEIACTIACKSVDAINASAIVQARARFAHVNVILTIGSVKI